MKQDFKIKRVKYVSFTKANESHCSACHYDFNERLLEFTRKDIIELFLIMPTKHSGSLAQKKKKKKFHSQKGVYYFCEDCVRKMKRLRPDDVIPENYFKKS